MLACCLTAAGAEQRFTSPDGTVVVVVDDEGGRPGYTISLNGKTFLTRSPLGVTTNMDDLTQGLVLKDCSVGAVHDSYTLRTIKQSQVPSLLLKVLR